MFNAEEPFWGKTLRIIRDIWPLGESDQLSGRVRADLPDDDVRLIKKAINACLEGRGGEVSARTRAAELGHVYSGLSSEGCRRFLELLAYDYDVDNVAIERTLEARSEITNPQELQQSNQRLREILESPRTRLLRQFTELNEGVKFLVDLRADLLPHSRKNPQLKALDSDLHSLLASWFDIGFLDLQRITWETPAVILEKLIKYESVHEISSWDDMKNRLRPDRRCYAFFHPGMPQEPLIFVEVALVAGIAGNVQELLDVNAPEGEPEKIDTAIFYSISNCQKGLAGVSFGNFLIKRVVADLAGKFQNLKNYSTLSPIPGFMGWLKNNAATVKLSGKEGELLQSIASADNPIVTLLSMFESAEVEKKSSNSEVFKNMLLKLCAKYLVEIKRGEQAFDRVAHFHLSNGARIERINWKANSSDSGVEQSAGLMVNYLYDLSQIERNHELYKGAGEISISSRVSRLLKM